MNFLRLKSTNPLYRQRFGDVDIKDFEVYSERKEAIGKIADVLTDQSQQAYYLVIEVGSWLSRKQVLLPLSRFEVAPAERRLYALGVSKAEIENLPLYAAREVKSDELHSPGSTLPEPVSILEASPPIEASLPLEPDAMVVPVVRAASTVPVAEPVARAVDQPVAATPLSVSNQPSEITGLTASSSAHTVAEETVRLLEERLIVDRQKRKVGEVIVRKAVETRMVEVPVRWERLIIEQVSPDRKQLASIDLHQEIDSAALDQTTLHSLELREPTTDSPLTNTVTNGSVANKTDAAQYIPINLANQVLYKLSQFPQFSGAQVQMSFADPELQSQYQRWLTERKD